MRMMNCQVWTIVATAALARPMRGVTAAMAHRETAVTLRLDGASADVTLVATMVHTRQFIMRIHESQNTTNASTFTFTFIALTVRRAQPPV